MKHALAIAAMLYAAQAGAQQDVNRNRISVYGGLTRYIGDLEQQWSNVDPEGNSYLGLDYQRFLGYGTSVYGKVSGLRIQGNDLQNGNYGRGLNFRTDLSAFELGFKTYLDNGDWLRYDARFAPFISIGAGIGNYTVHVDQFAADGSRYNYWSDGTIRNLPENSPDAGMAVITGQDGDFETDVTTKATEGGKTSSTQYLYVPAQAGLKIRISQRLSLDLAYSFNWTFSDRLDDISGDYPGDYATADLAYIANPTNTTNPRGNPNDEDHYHYVSIGIGYSFGNRSHTYRMIPLYVDQGASPQPPLRAVPQLPTPLPVPPRLEKKEPARAAVLDELRVKRLVIEELVVDTIIVRRNAVLEVPATVQPMIDTTATDTLAAQPIRLKEPVREPDQDSVTVVPKAMDSLAVAREKAVVDSIAPSQRRMRADSLRSVPGYRTDSIKALNVDDTLRVDPDMYEGTRQDTITAPAPKVRRVGPDTPMDTVMTNGSGQQPNETPPTQRDQYRPPAQGKPTPKPSAEVRTETRTVIVPVPAPNNDRDRQRIAALEDSLTSMRARQALLEAVEPPTDSSVVIGTRAVPVDTSLARTRLARSEIGRAHEAELNSLLMDRIELLEAYIALQEDRATATEQEAMRQRVLQLDRQVQALRDSLKTERKAVRFGPAVLGTKGPLDTSAKAPRHASTDTLFFSTNSRSVREEDKARVRELATLFKSQGSGRIIVTGHTDRSGKESYNEMLSQQRADVVAQLLREAGVAEEKIKVKGLGEKLARSTYNMAERNVVVQMIVGE